MSIDHWMMFSTFAEQDYFRFPKVNTYTGCIINANMASHAPAGLAAFLVEKTSGIRYIIDPLTHAFQHETSCITNSKNEVKKSIRELANNYGDPIMTKVGKKPLHPSDFADNPADLNTLAANCLQYQRTQLSEAILNNDSAKYLEGLELDTVKNPYSLVAPYFYMTRTTIDEWLPHNVEMAKIAVSKKENSEKVFAEVVIHQNILLSEDNVNRIIMSYEDTGVDGFLIWVDELDEHDSDIEILSRLLTLVRGLRNNGLKEVINLHGGYFSILAAGNAGRSALTGVSHGPEFGEHRAVVPVGGGIPISRYYIPELHNRIRYREARRILDDMGCLTSSEGFHTNVCNCETCQTVIEGKIDNFIKFGDFTAKNIPRGDGFVRRQFPTTDAKEICLKHYLERKVLEYKTAETKTKDELIAALSDSYAKYSQVMSLEEISHLKVWAKIFE